MESRPEKTMPADSIPEQRPMVTIVIVNYETSQFVRRCVETLHRQDWPHEIMIVDNPSPKQDWQNLPTEGLTLIRNSENVGYGLGCNEGAGEACEQSRYICILNPDTALPDGALGQWVRTHERVAPRGGITAPALLNDNGVVQKSSYRFTTFSSYWANHSIFAGFLKELRKGSLDTEGWNAPVQLDTGQLATTAPVAARDANAPRNVDWLMGAALLMDTATWNVLQGFSPRYFLYAEDADLCFRCHEAGLGVWYCPEVQIVHSQGEPGPSSRARNMVRLFDGIMRFVHYNYPPLKREKVRVAVLADMIMRIVFFSLMRIVRPSHQLSAPRTRGAWQVLKHWIVFRPDEKTS